MTRLHYKTVSQKIIFCVALLSFSRVAQAQTGNEWDDPTITSVNRETAHTISIPLGSEAEVQLNDMTISPYYQSLDGTWKFWWVETPSKATTDMCAQYYGDASWTDIDARQVGRSGDCTMGKLGTNLSTVM